MTEPVHNTTLENPVGGAQLKLEPGGTVSLVRIDLKPAHNGWRLLTITPTDEIPNDIGEFSSQTLARAAQWILEVDAAASTSIRSGRPVVKRVPESPRRSSLYSPDSLPPSGVLVWPLVTEQAALPLLPYQETGVDFLLTHAKAILADDMGLGKTIQAIAATNRLISTGQIRQALILCPRNVVENWIRELFRWTPGLCVIALRTRPSDRTISWQNSLGRSHILLTHYEELRTLPERVVSHEFELVIADEAHRLRNIDAATTQSARALHGRRFWALSGTPVERSQEDLVALMSLLEPQRFAATDALWDLSQLRRRVQPYILRRMKADVLSDLPSLEEHRETLAMTSQQANDYKSVVRRDMKSARTSEEFLAIFNLLRSICDISLDGRHSAKVDRVVELVLKIRASEEKIVCFSYMLEPLRLLQHRFAEVRVPCELLTGEVTAEERGERVDSFRQRVGTSVLIASSRVAGEGLNLTEANHVFFVNEWWNPSANDQARDRVVRIGQRRLVHVYRFRMAGTVEAVLDSIHQRKRAAATKLLNPKQLLDDPTVRARLFDVSAL